MPIFSVIMPAYNPGNFLRLAIESVINQSSSDWELVVVDDGSTEDILKVVEMDSRIRVIRQQNQGLSAARNMGILNSSGRYIAFLDADDLWMPTKLEKQLEMLEANEKIGLCHTYQNIISAEGHIIRQGFSDAINTYEQLLRDCKICVSTVVVRRECLASTGLFNGKYISVQDYDLWLKLIRHHSFAYVSSCEASYRLHGSNMSRSYRMICDERVMLLREHIAIAHSRKEWAAKRAALSNIKDSRLGCGCQAFDACRASFNRKDINSIARHFAEAFQLAPAYVTKSIIRYALRNNNHGRSKSISGSTPSL